MIVKIVCNGLDTFSKLYKEDENEYLIGIDAGAMTLLKNHLQPDLAIGDFDSSDVKAVKRRAKKTIVLESSRGESDLELALEHISTVAFEKKGETFRFIERVIVYNATGKRLDYYQANLNLLVKYLHMPIEIVDLYNKIMVINGRLSINRKNFHTEGFSTVSVFALEPDTKIMLKGFKRSFTEEELTIAENYVLANEIVAPTAQIKVNEKRALVFYTKKEA